MNRFFHLITTIANAFKKQKAFVLTFTLLFSIPVLNACTPIGVVVGAGATAGSMALEERGFKQGSKDLAMGLEINKLLVEKDSALFLNVGVTVHEARILLTGAVSDQDSRLSALAIVWKIDGVEEVINEIQITEEGGILDRSRDTIVKVKLASTLTFDEEVHAVNYYSSVVNGTVYLFGIAQDEKEIARVIDHAKQLSYVRRVVSHMRLKNDPDRIAWLVKNKVE